MNSIVSYFEQAQLALAAYSDVTPGISLDAYKLALQGDGKAMSPTQAASFASKWIVVDQYVDPVTGVSATVFQAVSGGPKYLAVRGTDGLDDIGADLDLAAGVPMELNLQYVALKAQVETWLENGTLSSGFTVTGHSLGGYLATGLVADFGDDIAHAYLYNAPGINGVLGDITASILGIFGITAPVDPAKISNIKADAGSSPIAGLGEQVASTIQITIEDQSFSDVSDPQLSFNHSQRVLTDSLALYAAYSQVDPTITVENITNIIKASSNLNVNTLEKALDNLRELLLGATIPGTVPEGRESYYTNLNELSEWLNARSSSGDAPALRLDPLIAYGGRALASLASADTSEGLAYRYAIAKLVPFAVTGDLEIYASHNSDGELDLYDPASGQGNLTEQYLKDRAAMLSWKMRFDTGSPDINDPLTPRADKPYAEDWDSWISGDWDFVDLSSGIKLTIDGWDLSTTANHQIAFGSRNADTLLGDKLSDNLYGGAGADTLTGKGGNDYLEGGQGDDTYIINPGDGHDTILDTDGLGVIKFGDVSALGRAGVTDGKDWTFVGNTWTDKQNNLTYVLMAQADGTNDLQIRSAAGSATVKAWSAGGLGIELAASAPLQPVIDQTISGDSEGNYLTDTAGNTRLVGGGGSDFLYASGGGDNILEGGAGSDILISQQGSDRLYADEMIDDLGVAILRGDAEAGTGLKGELLASGNSDDVVVGGQGNDTVLGGDGRDVIIAGAGDDNVIGDGHASIYYGSTWDVLRKEGTLNWQGAWATYPDAVKASPDSSDIIFVGDDFVVHWQLIDQHTPTVLVPVYDNFGVIVDYVEQYNGLSVTVFEEVATGQRCVAIRGTEVTDIGDLTADCRILLQGITTCRVTNNSEWRYAA